MKKSIYLLVGLILLINYSNAQKPSFGITAGAVFSSYKVKAESISVTSKTNAGFTLGMMASVPIGRYCSFMPAMNYVQKGGTFKSEQSKDKMALNYLELPLNFVYNSRSIAGNFFVGAGPSFSMGLSGKEKLEGDGFPTEKTDIKFGSDVTDDLKAFEAGVNFLAGYQSRGGFLVYLNYNTGLSNLANNDPQDPIKSKYYNRYFGIRIGYMFGAKK